MLDGRVDMPLGCKRDAIAVENGFFVLRLLCNRRETAAGEAFWSPWLDPIDNACVMQIIEGSQP